MSERVWEGGMQLWLHLLSSIEYFFINANCEPVKDSNVLLKFNESVVIVNELINFDKVST